MDWYDSSVKHALDILDKTPHTADRDVHSELEENLLTSVSALLKQLSPLQSSLSNLGVDIKRSEENFIKLQTLCAQLSNKTSPFAKELLEIRGKRTEAESDLATLDAVIQTLKISEEDKNNLETSEKDLPPQFFDSFNKIKRIQSEAAPLLLAEHPRAGEELMMETSKLLNSAYSKIYTSVLSGLQSSNSSKESLARLRQHMSLLADRPLEFKQILATQSSSRKTKLQQNFHKQLASEQIHAMVSPARFMGSVLAFVHAEIVNEFEYVYTIIGDVTGESQSTVNDLVEDTVKVFEVPLRKALSTLALNTRDLTILDECEGVLELYTQMLAKYNQPKINEALEYAKQEFDKQFALVAGDISDWETRVDVAYKVLQNSVQGVGVSTEQTQLRVKLLLNDYLTKSLAKLDEDKDYISALNMLDLVILKLTGFVSAESELQNFKKLESERVKKQVVVESSWIVSESKLEEFKTGLWSTREFCIQFDEFLSTVNERLSARLDLINSPRIASQINENAISQFISEYEQVMQPNMRSPESIRLLLL